MRRKVSPPTSRSARRASAAGSSARGVRAFDPSDPKHESPVVRFHGGASRVRPRGAAPGNLTFRADVESPAPVLTVEPVRPMQSRANCSGGRRHRTGDVRSGASGAVERICVTSMFLPYAHPPPEVGGFFCEAKNVKALFSDPEMPVTRCGPMTPFAQSRPTNSLRHITIAFQRWVAGRISRCKPFVARCVWPC